MLMPTLGPIVFFFAIAIKKRLVSPEYSIDSSESDTEDQEKYDLIHMLVTLPLLYDYH